MAVAAMVAAGSGCLPEAYRYYRAGQNAKDPCMGIRMSAMAIKSGDLPRRRLYRAYYNRGINYTKTGQYKRALADFSRAITIRPDLAPARNGRCWIKCRYLGGCREALADCRRAVELAPKDAQSWHSLSATPG